MKKIIILTVTFLFSGSIHAQLSPTENYIQTKTYLDYNGATPTKTAETVQYFDGLGRPKQVVGVKASPTGKDVVTHIEYDLFGRPTKDFLPIPQSGTQNGGIYVSPLGNASSVYGSEKIYSEKILENSPLDRIRQQIQVGNDWSSKPVKFEYDTNIDGEVKKYTTQTNWSSGTTYGPITQSGTYVAGQLYKNTITDEDGNKTIEFKNGQGQTLLVRKVLSATENADTYYVYNEYNQLNYVIPPLAAIATDINTVLSTLCYTYRYDGKNRVIIKKVPGKGWEFIIYDKADRVIMTQDAVMGASKQWLFTKYDQFGRPAYTGIYTSTQAAGTAGRAAEQALADALATNAVKRTSAAGFTDASGMPVYYDNNPATSYPSTGIKVLSINYYDTYPTGSSAVTNAFSQDLLADNLANPQTTKGMLTASYVKNIEDDQWTRNFFWYDTKGRNIGSRSDNHLGGYTVVNHKLDFAGVVHQTNTYHKRLAQDTQTRIIEKFTYDRQNRLLTHTHQVGTNPVEILAQNKYNELSQLESKKVGGISAASPLQQIDYKYNIRGWMTQLNDPSNLGTDLFGYKINYNQVEGLTVPDAADSGLIVKPKYNGNIAEVSWKTLTEANEPMKRYGYVYDPLNRLSAGFYQKAGNENAKEYFEKMEYDLNGNITRLQRSEGLLPGSTVAVKIDNLKYDYSGNRLTKVTDEQQNPSGYPYTVVPKTIEYDNGSTNGNGNMTKHLDKGISSIEYNYLNLPKQITQNSQVTSYLYRADGVKVKKLFDNLETHYLDGFQYKSTFLRESWNGKGTFISDPNEIPVLQLRIIPTSEGYYDALLNRYVYNFTDHLGNLRLSYTDLNKDGIIQPRRYDASNCVGKICIKDWQPGEIVEVNNYYPFGLLHNYTATTQNAYQYKYQEQELQETGFYSFKWRNYMPDVGRFFNVDPLAEKYPYWTPYAFSGNRVIDARELEGLEPVEINMGTKNLIIAVKGWQGGNPDPGKTQTKHYDKTSFVGALQKAFGSRSDTQVAVFDGSMNSRTPNDISTSIKDFRETSPDGKLILAGHSLGADNIVNVVNDNQNVKVDKTITIDISEPLGKADNKLSKNVNSADNYYQDNIFSVGGTKIEKVKGNNNTLINNTLVPNTTHTTIDNNKNVNDQIIKNVQKVISQ